VIFHFFEREKSRQTTGKITFLDTPLTTKFVLSMVIIS